MNWNDHQVLPKPKSVNVSIWCDSDIGEGGTRS